MKLSCFKLPPFVSGCLFQPGSQCVVQLIDSEGFSEVPVHSGRQTLFSISFHRIGCEREDWETAAM